MCESPRKISVRGGVYEMFGTLGVVFMVCGAMASNRGEGPQLAFYTTVVAAAYGWGTAAMTYATAYAKGGQLNPAVSLALCICGYISFMQFIINMFFQCVGAVVACFLLQGMFNNGLDGLDMVIDKTGDLGSTHFDTTGRIGQGHAFLTEAGGAFLLCFVAICCSCNKNNHAAKYGTPLAMGFTVYALVLTIFPVTGASFNPARSTAPSLVSNKYTNQLWVYWLGPLTGGLIAGIFGRVFWITPDEAGAMVSAPAAAKAPEANVGDVELKVDDGELADQVRAMRDAHKGLDAKLDVILSRLGSEDTV